MWTHEMDASRSQLTIRCNGRPHSTHVVEAGADALLARTQQARFVLHAALSEVGDCEAGMRKGHDVDKDYVEGVASMAARALADIFRDG
jgi:hypothetical protein